MNIRFLQIQVNHRATGMSFPFPPDREAYPQRVLEVQQHAWRVPAAGLEGLRNNFRSTYSVFWVIERVSRGA